MDDFLANHNVGLAIIDATNITSVPTTWTLLADLRPAGLFADDPYLHYVFYARGPMTFRPRQLPWIASNPRCRPALV